MRLIGIKATTHAPYVHPAISAMAGRFLDTYTEHECREVRPGVYEHIFTPPKRSDEEMFRLYGVYRLPRRKLRKCQLRKRQARVVQARRRLVRRERGSV